MKERVYEEATSAPKAFGLRQSLYIMASIVLIQKFLEFWVVTFYADISQPNTQEVALFFKKLFFTWGFDLVWHQSACHQELLQAQGGGGTYCLHYQRLTWDAWDFAWGQWKV